MILSNNLVIKFVLFEDILSSVIEVIHNPFNTNDFFGERARKKCVSHHNIGNRGCYSP